ncbi:bacteriocin [Elizabethkingia ursingii]|nr:bacteriocin [Elizabethkingia ursingii]
MKKLQKNELKKVIGGMAPKCCIDWDPIKRRCYQWDFGCLEN